MKLRNKEKMFKDCPRCGIRCLATAESCQECGLVFARMEIATNADAKKKMKRHDKDYIIKTSQLPSDISFAKLLTLCICTGIVGGHCYYVGKYKQAIIQTIAVSIILLFGALNSWIYANNLGQAMEVISVILGFTMMLWPLDLVMILMKKFKVPVAIDIDGDLAHAKQKEEYLSSVKEAAKEVEVANATKETKLNSETKIEVTQNIKQGQIANDDEPAVAENLEIIVEDGGTENKQEGSEPVKGDDDSSPEQIVIDETQKQEEKITEKTAAEEKAKPKVAQNRSKYKQTVKKYDSKGKKKRKK